jgi:hypothetical protein
LVRSNSLAKKHPKIHDFGVWKIRYFHNSMNFSKDIFWDVMHISKAYSNKSLWNCFLVFHF